MRSILYKLTKGDAPDIFQMNSHVKKMLESVIQANGVEKLFEIDKNIPVDIFSEEYITRLNSLKFPNTKIKLLQQLASKAIKEYRKVNKVQAIEFSERLKRIVDAYNERKDRDFNTANDVFNDISERIIDLMTNLKEEQGSFVKLGINYEEKAFFDILRSVSQKFEFEYPDDKMIELAKKIKEIVDNQTDYVDWDSRDDIKADLQVGIIVLMDKFGFPPVVIDDVFKEVLEQAENYKKYH